MTTAPAASGGARLYLLNQDGIVASASARDLPGPELSRLGESLAEIGHPPGTENVFVFGAPGALSGASGRVTAPAVVAIDLVGGRSFRELLRVEGGPGSLFGWRVLSTDSQFPAASFHGSFVVAAPLEDRGNQARAGAVYKFDAVTGRQLWKFHGQGAGELAGYDILAVADQNGDDRGDVLVGAPGSRSGDPTGRVYLVSGANGKLIRTIDAPEGALLFGFALALCQGRTCITAPATDHRRKTAAGALYVFDSLEASAADADPAIVRGVRPDQWFGVSVTASMDRLYVGSFEGSKKPNRDRRGSVTVFSDALRRLRTLKGKDAGGYLGRSISAGRLVLSVGSPFSPPLLLPV